MGRPRPGDLVHLGVLVGDELRAVATTLTLLQLDERAPLLLAFAPGLLGRGHLEPGGLRPLASLGHAQGERVEPTFLREGPRWIEGAADPPAGGFLACRAKRSAGEVQAGLRLVQVRASFGELGACVTLLELAHVEQALETEPIATLQPALPSLHRTPRTAQVSA